MSLGLIGCWDPTTRLCACSDPRGDPTLNSGVGANRRCAVVPGQHAIETRSTLNSSDGRSMCSVRANHPGEPSGKSTF
eukprot:6083242-Prymnesium_polylepis.1